MNSLRRSLALAALLALAPALVRAQSVVAGAPTTIDYQGKALDSSGNPLANTTATNFEMWFRIYDAQESGTIIWSEKQIVTVSKGLFSVRLGEGTVNGSEPQPSLAEAFNGNARFLGVTIVITGQSSVEILPRLAFLATPYAYVATKSISAERLILNPSTSAAASSINLGQVSYATQFTSSTITLSDQNHTAIADAGAGAITVNLPGVTTRREYYIVKKDSSVNIVTVTPPSGGAINGVQNASIKLKVLGESVVIQNTDGNNWWVVSDTRDKTPVGTIISSGINTSTPPPGYLFCNGTAYSRTGAQYVDLFAVLGGAWGYTSASDFRVPDLRGMFLRGVDGGRGADDDRNSRTTSNQNGNAGDAVGSYEGAAVGSHNHTFSASANTSTNGGHQHGIGGGGNGARGLARTSANGENRTANGVDTPGSGSELDILSSVSGIPWDGDHAHSVSVSGTTSSTGAGETRPENVNVNYFIKY